MLYKRTLTTLGLIICITLLLTTCGRSSTPSPEIHLEEDGSEIQFTEEVIRLTNCGNPASTEQTKTRFFSVTADRVTGLQLDYYVVEGNIQARYQQYASIATSQKLIAAPNTDMEFVLRWSEEVHRGTFAVGDKTGFYSVSIPMAVDQISGRDLVCPNDMPLTTQLAPPALQPQPTSTPQKATLPSHALCPVIVIEGSINGLPIAQTKTWAELSAQGIAGEPQSADLSQACSRDPDNEVQVWVGYWSGNPGYLDYRKTMNVADAITLVMLNSTQPAIIVPWGD